MAQMAQIAIDNEPDPRWVITTPFPDVQCPGDDCTGILTLATPSKGYWECECCGNECQHGAPDGFTCTGADKHVFCGNECLEEVEGKGPHQWLPLEIVPGVRSVFREAIEEWEMN